LLAASSVGVLFAAAPSGASAAPTFDCSASAIRATVLGQSIEPFTANAGKGTCQPAISSLAQPPTLPAPLSARAIGAQTDLTGAGGPAASQQATATAAIVDLAVKSLPSLPIALPTAPLPAGLNAVTVPLSAQLQALGLPSVISVNVLPAVTALLPTQALPNLDLVDVHQLTSTASATCVSGAPQLTGSSQVAGISVLGQTLPVGQVVNQALTLIGAQTINLSSLDITKVQLPAGLSFNTTPAIVGQLLQQAVQAVIAKLPPVQIPATLAQVQITPAQQTNSNGTLVQRALAVKVSILGTSIADLVLGEARVSGSGVSCADAPAAATTTSQLALQCTKRKLTLIDVIERSDHVALLGAADKSLVGHTVDIVFGGQKVASAVVRDSGFFRAQLPLPPASIRHTNDARYQAVVGHERSLRLKLERRMHISSLRHRGSNVVIRGRITGPLGSPRIAIQRRVSCTSTVTVAHVRPNADGSWTAVVPAPAHEQAAVYRATTQVRHSTSSDRKFPTFTLPGYVTL
jgi:hypothetical protein